MAKEEATKVFLHKFRLGLSLSIGLLSGMTGASIPNITIFAAGIANATALGVYSAFQQMTHKRSVIITFIASTVGALLPVSSYAFMKTNAALVASMALTVFLLFAASSTSLENKTFKDGIKNIGMTFLIAILTFIVGILIRPML